MGHALVASGLPGVDPVQKVSIIPRGVGALGYTIQRPTEDRFLLSRTDLENRVAVLLGGRAAEAMLFDGDVSTGAADDLQRATEIALEMVTRHGMDPTVGERVYAPRPQSFLGQTAPEGPVSASEATAREIDLAVRSIVEAGAARARGLLEQRRAELDAGAELLLGKETLTADEFPPLKGAPLPRPADRAA
jgi:cell division protease FtsH